VRFYLADQANAQLVIMNTTTNGITLLPLGATPSGVAISEDASELWVGKLDGTVARLHPTAFTALGSVTVGGEVRNIALSPDGTLALLGIGSGTVLIRR
jgi:DNA-binding beta-propeller fold protein YncE